MLKGKILMGGETIIISQGKRNPLGFKKRQRSLTPILIFMAVMILMGLDAHIRSITTQYMYKTSDSYVKLEQLSGRKAELLAEIASLKNPRRIERIALKRLGLKEPDSERVLIER